MSDKASRPATAEEIVSALVDLYMNNPHQFETSREGTVVRARMSSDVLQVAKPMLAKHDPAQLAQNMIPEIVSNFGWPANGFHIGGQNWADGVVDFCYKAIEAEFKRRVPDYEKLDDERWDSADALARASGMLSNQIIAERAQAETEKSVPSYATLGIERGSAVMTYQCVRILDARRIVTIDKLASMTANELLAINGIGEASLKRIRIFLALKGRALKGERVFPRQPFDSELTMPIADLQISDTLRRRLARVNVETIGELIALTEAEYLAIPNLGRKTFNMLRGLLRNRGLYFKGDAPKELKL